MKTVIKGGVGFASPTTAEQPPAAEASLEEKPEDSSPEAKDAIAVEFDEDNGTAKIQLENGLYVTLKEPKTKDFVRFTSKMETSEIAFQSGTMAVFWFSHLMIDSVTDAEGKPQPKPTFEQFEDMWQDKDPARIGAAFACFPDVMPRYKRFSETMVSSSGA